MLTEQVQKGRLFLTVPWNDTESAQFRVLQHLVRSQRAEDDGHGKNSRRRFKDVYLGMFTDGVLPAGIKPFCQYYLKVIHTDIPKNKLRIACLREQFDLYPYKGAHFRNILAMNDRASHIVEQLSSDLSCDELSDCLLVEPCYATLENDAAAVIEQMTVWERLEYVRQYCCALLELFSDENRIAGHRILAHRDVKIENGLILRKADHFTVILVDMATVLLEDCSDGTGPDVLHLGDGPMGTAPGLMSPGNSSPEMSDRSYPMSSKVDVFALGGILATLFGYCSNPAARFSDRKTGDKKAYRIRNPIIVWHMCQGWGTLLNGARNRENAGPGGSNNGLLDQQEQELAEKHIRKLRECYRKWADWDRDPANRGKSWLEHDLAVERSWSKREAGSVPALYSFVWENETDSPYKPSDPVLRKIQSLFYRCTRLHPNDRISLEELLEEIQQLMASVPKEQNLNNEVLYTASEAVYLYDLQGAGRQNLAYKMFTKRAAVKDQMAYRCGSFTLTGIGPEVSPLDPDSDLFDSSFRDGDDLNGYVSQLSPAMQSGNKTLHHALYNLSQFYSRYRDVYPFSGKLRIFTTRPIGQVLCETRRIKGEDWSVEELLDALEARARGPLEVCIYSNAPQTLPEEADRITVVPVTYGRSEKQAPAPEKQTPAPEKPAAPVYDCGAEGLYCMIGGKRIYVSRKGR